MKTLAIVVALVAALASPAAANCLRSSQDAVTAVQLADAYSITAYTWAGDPWYDQVMPLCAKTAVREFGCAAAVNVGIRAVEDHLANSSPATTTRICVANYLGALGYAVYIRRAVAVQILRIRF